MKISNRIKFLLFAGLMHSHFSLSYKIETKREDYPAIVEVHEKSNKDFFGTAFFISPELLVTNFHVISDLKGLIDKSFFIETVEGKTVPIEAIAALDGMNDLAVLKVKAYQSKNYYNIQSNSKKLKQNQKIQTAGFPHGQFQSVKGRIQNQIYDNVHFEIRKTTGPGASGSPVFSKSGDLIGIYKWYYEGSGSSVMVSSKKLKQLLSKAPLYCNSSACIKEEIRRIENLAEKGNKKAQFNLFVIYYDGIIFEIDSKKKNVKKELAFKRLKDSAEKGHIEAQFKLGSIYYLNKEKMKKNSKLAFEWIQKSAHQGYFPAQYQLSRMYFDGVGVKQDKVLALKLMLELAERKSFTAEVTLGYVYIDSMSEAEVIKALAWFEEAKTAELNKNSAEKKHKLKPQQSVCKTSFES